MKNYVINRLKEAGIIDENFCNEVFSDCQSAIEDTLNEKIDYWKHINDPKNIHEELWWHNDNIFELDIAIENWDTHIVATITPQEETGKYICKLEKTCLGLDRDAIINEMYCGHDIREYVHWDHKKIMAMIYLDFEDELRSYLKEQQ